jgi:hypothetical protein
MHGPLNGPCHHDLISYVIKYSSFLFPLSHRSFGAIFSVFLIFGGFICIIFHLSLTFAFIAVIYAAFLIACFCCPSVSRWSSTTSLTLSCFNHVFAPKNEIRF